MMGEETFFSLKMFYIQPQNKLGLLCFALFWRSVHYLEERVPRSGIRFLMKEIG